MKRSRFGGWMRRGLAGLGALVVVVVAVALAAGWTGYGKRAAGERRERMRRSAQWRDGKFRNPQPLYNAVWGALKAMFEADRNASPSAAVATAAVTRAALEQPPASGLRVTWFGHSSLLIEIDGIRVLTDPMWARRSSPIQWIGPTRWYPPPIALAELPPIDAVVISHDHFDHLDHSTIAAIKDWPTTFIVPLGVGAHLAYWGVPEARIVELDWWERTRVRGLEVVCTPARHASGRMLVDNDATLWAGYAFVGARHRAFYSGDTGLFPALKDIGDKLGPFDVTLIEIGQYHRAWPDWHIGPEQAVKAHGLLRGRVFFPIHWGLLQLAMHAWTEPAERALAAATAAGATIVVPKPGQSVEIETPLPLARWWPALPWKTGAEDPIVSTGLIPGYDGAR